MDEEENSEIEQLEYAGYPEDERGRKTVEITAFTSDDEGLVVIEQQSMELEIPATGILQIAIEGDGVGFQPNTIDGNPRVEQ